MLRITQLIRPDGRRVLLLEGRLVGAWVAELRRAVGDSAGPTTVDLAAVAFADADGVTALRRLRGAGAEIRYPHAPLATVSLSPPTVAFEDRRAAASRRLLPPCLTLFSICHPSPGLLWPREGRRRAAQPRVSATK